MQYPSDDIRHLYEQALIYQDQGDVYNAVKLFKRLIRLAPSWLPPFKELSLLYKYRRDWKAALHYAKKSVALDPSYRTGWWNIGIAATALKKERVAKRVWNKFGLEANKSPYTNPVGLKLEFEKKFEILWTKTISPAKARIISIPMPATDRRFQDLVLYDEEPAGFNVIEGKKHPVFDELGLIKRSRYHTFSVQIHTTDNEVLNLLEQLCFNNQMGFENWSNATKAYSPKEQKEFYGKEILPEAVGPSSHIAIAALKEFDAQQVLQAWSIISLKQYSDLVQHL
jgi:hypothetical protein